VYSSEVTLPLDSRRKPRTQEGFTLVESLIALFILCFGLLAVGQLLFTATAGPALARSKDSATRVAENKMEVLADAYRQNPDGADLTVGNHGPETVTLQNPVDGRTLNRYEVRWTVSIVTDPRPGKVLKAKQVRVHVRPIDNAGAAHDVRSFNKVIYMTSIFSIRPV
jgi:prepilin-type N-terminal cleavage/methylation domain-containing protein